MISDTYDMTEVEDGFFYEVEGNVSRAINAQSRAVVDMF